MMLLSFLFTGQGVIFGQTSYNVSSAGDFRTLLTGGTLNDGDVIRLAAGTYTPSSPRDSTVSFVVNKAITISGGWNASFTDRDPSVYSSILSGDYNNNDAYDHNVPSLTGLDDNANQVLIWDVSSSAQGRIDGVVIQGGRGATTADKATGLTLVSGKLAIVNTTLKHNKRALYAGVGTTLKVDSCTFTKNYSGTFGTAVTLIGSIGAVITNSVFDKNAAAHSPVYLNNGAGLIVSHSTFFENIVSIQGGAVIGVNGSASTAKITFSTFIDNTRVFAGNSEDISAVLAYKGKAETYHCTFIGNVVQGSVLQARGDNSRITFGGSVFLGNTTNNSGTNAFVTVNESGAFSNEGYNVLNTSGGVYAVASDLVNVSYSNVHNIFSGGSYSDRRYRASLVKPATAYTSVVMPAGSDSASLVIVPKTATSSWLTSVWGTLPSPLTDQSNEEMIEINNLHYAGAVHLSEELEAVLYINGIPYDEADGQSFSPGSFTIKVDVDFEMSSDPGHIRWYINGVEESSAVDQLQWTKSITTPGVYIIKTVLISASNKEITLEAEIMIPDFRWFYISSPYANATSNNFDKPAGTIGTASVAGGSLLGYYNESAKEYSNPFGLGVTFAPGRGIVAQLDINIPEFNPPTIATFANGSTPNPASFTVPVTSTVGEKAGKNLLGNPYLTAIDFDALISLGSNSDVIDPSYWIRRWDGSTMMFESYNTTLGGGTGLLDEFIPVVQAFWVNSKVASGNVSFSNTIAASPSPAPARSSAAKVSRIARLKVSSADRSDEMLLALHPGASNAYDAYKTEKMANDANSRIPELYTKIGNRELSINGVPPANNEVTIPLGFRTRETGIFTISSTFENWDNTRIFLRDNTTGIETELTAGNNYSFSSNAYDNTSRFSIIIGAPLGVNTVEHNTKIFVNENNRIIVETDIPNAECTVYNTLGQQLSFEIVTLSPQTLDCVLESGVYLVKLGNKTERVIIK